MKTLKYGLLIILCIAMCYYGIEGQNKAKKAEKQAAKSDECFLLALDQYLSNNPYFETKGNEVKVTQKIYLSGNDTVSIRYFKLRKDYFLSDVKSLQAHIYKTKYK